MIMRKNIYFFIALLMGLFFQKGMTQPPECTILYCQTDIRVAAGNNCEALIIPEYVIPDNCMVTNYQMTIYDEDNNVVPNPVTQEYFYRDLVVEFIALDLDDTCETNMVVEDKLPPKINSINGPSDIYCLSDLESLFIVDAEDNCDFTVEVTEINELATIGNVIEVEITWTATDIAGRQDSKTILVNLIDYWDIVQWPSMLYVVDCEADLVDAPEPVIYNDPNCPRQISMDYVDYRSGCIINRVWTITDVESGLQTSFTQELFFNKPIAPEIIAPDEEQITLDEYINGWELDYYVVDDCDPDPTVWVSWNIMPVRCNRTYFKIIYTINAEDDCGNTSTHVTVVHVKSKRKAKVNLTGKKSCNQPFVILTNVKNMVPPYSYNYSVNNITWTVTDLGNGRAIVNPGIGSVTIKVEVTDQIGCIKRDKKKYKCRNVPFFGRSIREGELSIHPNPTTGDLNISAVEWEEVTLFNLEGRMIRSWNNSIQDQLNISDLKNGVYMIRVQTESEIMTQKIIKI
jgi:hypothetical protein